MRPSTWRLDDLRTVILNLGYVGENLHTRIIIDCKKMFDQYPNASVSMTVTPPEGEPYPGLIERDGDLVIWDVRDCDLVAEGDGEIQIVFTQEPHIARSYNARTHVCRSQVPTGDVPSGLDDFITRADQLLDEVKDTFQAGGTTGQVLAKKSDTDYDTEWVDQGGGTEDYDELENRPQIGGVTLTGNKTLHDLGAASEADVEAKYTKPETGIPASDLAAGVIPDPEDLIDDTAGAGDTDKVWSADKTHELLTEINSKQDIENAVRYVLSRKFNVGENLLTNETTFTGTGWSGSLSTGFTHATGNTDPIVFSASTVEDQAYIIDFDYSGDIGGDNMFVTIGDMPKVDVYHGAIRPFVGVVSDGGYLKIYCKSTYTGTITNLKIRPVLQSGGTEVVFECAEITNGQNPNEISSWHVVAIGRDVLSKNVNGTRTVAIGDRALEKIITGHRNIAIGPYAMPFVTEGDCNVSIGADTLYNPSYNTGESKAYSNVAIGKGTMLNGTLIQNNIAVGHGAMGNNATDSEENVCIGRQAGYNTGKNNTFIGHRAGYYYNGTGVDNVCIGHNAGFNAYHNGFNNVYIGADARANVSGASASNPKTCNNSIAIGKGAYVTGSFQIVIGNANYSTVKIAGKTLSFNEDGTVTWS